MPNKSKEGRRHIRAYEEFLKQKTAKIDLNSLIIEIERTENVLTDKAKMGLISENYSDNTIREEVINSIGKPDDISIEVTATSRIAKGKKILWL